MTNDRCKVVKEPLYSARKKEERRECSKLGVMIVERDTVQQIGKAANRKSSRREESKTEAERIKKTDNTMGSI